MLINKELNSSTYIKSLSEKDKKNTFNLLASTLVSAYTNSLAIFGDVFFISIGMEYYDLLLMIDELEKNISDNEEIIKIELDEKKERLKSFKEIYYDYNIFNYLESIGSVMYVKIYEKISNNAVYYSREYLQNFVGSRPVNFNNGKIICINFEGKEIYIKHDKPLPSSHHSILSMIDLESNQSNSYYFIDLTKSDIIYLKENNLA